ncbi:MAG: 30S ribosome-binding factor RbfA [Candidatus Omnitrophica bacterium]|nr:30S ribosome-binding factor RbfA [Candidatus Omnitrophota bacterium]MDE2009807.1 30S ribosome-binding factor RbfA [Candidatus Omnitrophota bacterium]MDE2215394.1 30S ribosome-binding factor RbfA [Candidatus Omnitrophota bacterium]MDE2231506.1 30S ribosome-binding factor RbfA [Candidatus Omnitrophota bacterium]
MRIEKVNSTIKRELGMILQYGEISDPRISFVTIMSVETSKDLQHSKVKFSILSDDPKDIEAALAGFESCRGHIRRLIGQRVELRYTPQFQFIYDKSVKYAADVDKTLEEIKKLKTA